MSATQSQYTQAVSDAAKQLQVLERLMEITDNKFQQYVNRRELYEQTTDDRYGEIVNTLSKAADKSCMESRKRMMNIYFSADNNLDEEVAALDRIAAVLALVRKVSHF